VTRAASTNDAGAPTQRDTNGHAAGDVVDGRYVLIEQLGKGGMGVVWKARSTALDVEVAVKLVRSSPNPSADAFKRMAREAHAAARLGHPAMATVLDFGATSSGDPYVVMELLHGESLGDVLGRERRMDAVRAVGTLLPILEGLREAHDKGIVHRDIKPENLFLSRTARGRLQPKVLDFGIAKLEAPDEKQARLTQDGAVLGSPGYFSPEQARGETDIDLRTDVWSICVVLYELVTGELPFSGPNYNALLMAILKETPKPITDYGYGDAELWAIIQRGLHRERAQRWSSMWELGRALAGWLYERGVLADVTSRSIKEVWLDPRSASEQAPSPLAFGQEGARRRALSTILRPRVADTLAGGQTISTLIAQHRLPTRVLGWSAAAVSLCAIVWSLAQVSGGAPSAHPAALPAGTALAPAPTPAPVEPPRPAPGAAPAPAPLGDAVARGTRTASERKATLAPAKAPAAAVSRARASEPSARSRAAEPAPVAARPRPVDAAPKALARPAMLVAKPKPVTVTRKGIDEEFGF
jgi:eukaryotic-like serine/threonine-protein kinase